MANKISGTGIATTRKNEITADDVATLRDYIIGFDSGLIPVITLIGENNVLQVRFNCDLLTGQLILTKPDNYQGTEFSRVEDNLIATTSDEIEEISLYVVNGLLKGEQI